jgi:putative endonuclease
MSFKRTHNPSGIMKLHNALWNRSAKPPSKLGRLALARIGEEVAARLLLAGGYRILERNARCNMGELDIVAQEGQVVVFVEVKARTSERFGRPVEAVGKTKQRKLANLAAGYVAGRIRKEVAWRFDVVEVWLTEDGKVKKTNLIKGAFRPER